MQDNTFTMQSSNVAAALRIGNFAAWKFLAATTAVLAYAMLHEFLSAQLSGQALILATLAGVILIYFLIDAGLAGLLGYYFKAGRSGTRSQRIFGHFIVLLIVLKVIATMTTSLWAAPEIADTLTSNHGEEQAIAALLNVDSSQQAAQSTALARLQELEATEAERVQRAKREGEQLVSAAINRGNKWQIESYRSIGFAYIESADAGRSNHRYARDIRAAQAKALALVEAERQRTLAANGNLANVTTDTSYQRTATLLASKAQAERTAYEEKRSRRRGYIWLADIIAGVFGIFFTYLLSVREKAIAEAGEQERRVAHVVSAAQQKWHSNLISWLETILGVDINGDGTIGGTVPTPQKQHTGTAPGIGFAAIKNRSGNNAPKQPETTLTETAETIVAQAVSPKQRPPKQPETTPTETGRNNAHRNNKTTHETTHETTIVSAPSEDVSKWKKYAVTYYKRSIKPTSAEETRQANFEKYAEYRELLETAGHTVTETETTIIIIP